MVGRSPRVAPFGRGVRCSTRLNGVLARGLLIGDREQHIGVAGFIEWAVTREVAPAKLPFRFPDRDR
jgi:hypothetical protein